MVNRSWPRIGSSWSATGVPEPPPRAHHHQSSGHNQSKWHHTQLQSNRHKTACRSPCWNPHLEQREWMGDGGGRRIKGQQEGGREGGRGERERKGKGEKERGKVRQLSQTFGNQSWSPLTSGEVSVAPWAAKMLLMPMLSHSADTWLQRREKERERKYDTVSHDGGYTHIKFHFRIMSAGVRWSPSRQTKLTPSCKE